MGVRGAQPGARLAGPARTAGPYWSGRTPVLAGSGDLGALLVREPASGLNFFEISDTGHLALPASVTLVTMFQR
jgi:hypothetical protein